MDIRELRKMLKNSTAVLILDNGEPSFVVVNYETYKNMAASEEIDKNKGLSANGSESKGAVTGQGEVELLERINKDILALKAEIEKEEETLSATVE